MNRDDVIDILYYVLVFYIGFYIGSELAKTLYRTALINVVSERNKLKKELNNLKKESVHESISISDE